MSQQATWRMLNAVEWANVQLELFGLSNTVVIVHSFGAARLCEYMTGRELQVVEDGDGTPEGAIVLLVARLEYGLHKLFGRPLSSESER